mmetsp:Transcript_25041/g.47582  ORF Transcript_25041/g.47582 Transcript_25041/m.47582 type:complete len:366 (+) Transcript_25041:1758-2855(+)
MGARRRRPGLARKGGGGFVRLCGACNTGVGFPRCLHITRGTACIATMRIPCATRVSRYRPASSRTSTSVRASGLPRASAFYFGVQIPKFGLRIQLQATARLGAPAGHGRLRAPALRRRRGGGVHRGGRGTGGVTRVGPLASAPPRGARRGHRLAAAIGRSALFARHLAPHAAKRLHHSAVRQARVRSRVVSEGARRGPRVAQGVYRPPRYAHRLGLAPQQTRGDAQRAARRAPRDGRAEGRRRGAARRQRGVVGEEVGVAHRRDVDHRVLRVVGFRRRRRDRQLKRLGSLWGLRRPCGHGPQNHQAAGAMLHLKLRLVRLRGRETHSARHCAATLSLTTVPSLRLRGAHARITTLARVQPITDGL